MILERWKTRLQHGRLLQTDVYLDGYWTGTTNERYYYQFLFGGNLEDVEHISDTDFKDTCARYVKRTNGPFPHILTPIHKQLLKSLVLWEKDQVSAQKYS